MSMSSATDSTFSGQAHTGSAERVHVDRSNISAAMFPSPTPKRPAHKLPESTADITAHLLKASGRNESRIVPRLSPARLAPTVGTPIGDKVSEEAWPGGRDEDSQGPPARAKINKLDQVLGEGAETARVLMEFDRRAFEDVVVMPNM
jgi:hypothetical protein